jgi:hypothetical protein
MKCSQIHYYGEDSHMHPYVAPDELFHLILDSRHIVIEKYIPANSVLPEIIEDMTTRICFHLHWRELLSLATDYKTISSSLIIYKLGPKVVLPVIRPSPMKGADPK